MSFEILRKVLAHLLGLCSSAYEAELFRAAFALAFFGSFRIGELVSPSRAVHGGMLAHEVCCTEDKVSLVLCRSKMDQGGEGRKARIFSLPGSNLSSGGGEGVSESTPRVSRGLSDTRGWVPSVSIPICCGVPENV